MKGRVCFLSFFLFLFALGANLFAFGSSEETEVKVYNEEWILCVTDFDFSSVANDKLPVASVITKKIVDRLNVISYRTRVSPEYAFYEGNIWSRSKQTAAKNLSAKLDERANLLYKGESEWKYKQSLAKVDADIEKLRLVLEETENEAPLINREPVFRLTDGNKNMNFPAVPKEKNEYKFCSEQKADAFLSGKIFDYHGRFHVSIKLYALYSQSFRFEDSIIFSPDDMETALDELTRRLLIELSSSRPAKLAIKSQPEETLVLINRSFAGKGSSLEMEYPPGKITITASAPEHDSMTVETELLAGELAEVDIKLLPSEKSEVIILGPSQESSVYHGAMYVGEAPLTLRLPVNTYQYIEIESTERKGAAVFMMPEDEDYEYSASLRSSKIPKKNRVKLARNMYYWGWGLTWLAGIAAWLTYYSYTNHYEAFYDKKDIDQGIVDQGMQLYNLSMGAAIAAGALFAVDVFQIGRYLYVGTKGSPSIIKVKR